MEKLFRISILIFAVIILSCSDRDPTNPYDPEVGTEFPPVTLNSVTVVDIAKLQIAWTSNYEYYTIFELERSTIDQILGFNIIAEIPQGIFSYADTLVNADTTYYYRVKGMVDELHSSYSNILSGNLTLPAPSQLSLLALNDNQIQLTWSFPASRSYKNNSKIEIESSKEGSRFDFGFAIERKDDDGNFVEIARVDSDIYSFVDSELSSEILYTYRMRAYLNQSYSEYSSNIIIHTMPLIEPSSLIAEPLSDQIISLSWIDNCPFEEGFSIERKADGGVFEEIAQLETDVTSYLDEGLTFGTSYTYRVAAISVYNSSEYSNEVTAGTIFPAPSNLSLTALSDHQVEVQWNYALLKGEGYYWIPTSSSKKTTDLERRKWNSAESENRFEEGFSIERKTTGSDFIEVGSTEAGVTQFNDSGLLFGESYTYRIRAYTSLNYSGYSGEVTISTVFPTPNGLSSIALDDQSTELTWNDNCDFEDFYNVERSEDLNTYEEVGVLEANTTTFADEGLLFGIVYYYRVRASTGLNFSEYSEVDTLVTIFPTPSDLVTEATSDESIELDWNDNCSFEEGYSVEINNGSGYAEIVFTTNNTCNILGLEYGLQYSFRVRAKHGINYSLPVYADGIIELLAPENLTINAEDDQTIHIQWTAMDSFEEGFSVERSINGSAFEEIVVTAFDVYQYWDYGLIYGNNYTYRIRSFANEYNSPYSSEATSTTYFPAPSNLESEILSDTVVELSWLDNCSFETGYAIERRDAGSSFVEIAQVAANNTSYTDSGLTYGLHYYYRVRAFTDINFSNYSSESSQLVEITAPTGLTATAGTTSITLNWDDNTLIEENYEIERKIAGEDFVVIATISEDATNFTDTNVENIVTYFYRVRAVTANNQSEYSNIANATVVGE
ncbi:MAG: fibronectin type III domain-containing protein [Candidatus Tenebribacter mawsonii]|nr:fibronectin type III domain-containing protein [Candidatus Tenebribacter mawsonii]